ncbi:aminotransferase class I/II-fold pyridoxal phosphate-dependent enzyme [Microvirga aerilata]|uniref:8-amino-7-oxononanoate synthase n=1 Tax=Microvirga aerilata TaxID=670292 RepID=A0A936ZCN3_9HYPH|nr:aminotransferase class I/II-fold pyridoxal phosphate-dependent enzyme [Microvirga aerilata]MBL0407381.1 aminotransferase class I/II-fold pyridoxal phosphate-dependent enzyme [Microvirga aerilata]
MIDFTSSLYLGLRHPSSALGSWDTLTLGKPASLEEPPGAAALANALARLQGQPAAVLLPSTLHLFWDFLHFLKHQGRMAVLLDAGAYPIARWAAEAVWGRSVHMFAHHDVQALATLAVQVARGGHRPVILADGYCPTCNQPAPLQAFAEIAAAHGGWLVLDDTQGVGVLGSNPTSDRPYGTGGGGSMHWQGVGVSNVVVGASLAKAFGAPAAVLAGPRPLLQRFMHESRTRLHCSPLSVAVITAAHEALRWASIWGDFARHRLVALARRLRERLAQVGLAPVGELPFPVQSFPVRSRAEALRLQSDLLHGGVRVLLTSGWGRDKVKLTFIVTATHREYDIDHVARMLAGHLLAA